MNLTTSVSRFISRSLSFETAQIIEGEWIAIDGKVMRGTLNSGDKQAIIHAVSHESTGIAKILRANNYKVQGIDFNPDLVHKCDSAGHSVHYGDAEDPELIIKFLF
jgi:hypothetical protein